MDLDDKAVSRFTHVPPALLEEIHGGNNAALEGLARAQLVFLMERTLERAIQPDAPANLVTSTMETLRKMGVPQKAEAGGGQAFNLTLNLGSGHSPVTIEGQPVLEMDDD